MEAPDCPKCGKRTIVEHGDGNYECLSCGFKCSLSKSEESNKGGSGSLVFAIVVLAFFAWWFQFRHPVLTQQNKQSQPQPTVTAIPLR